MFNGLKYFCYFSRNLETFYMWISINLISYNISAIYRGKIKDFL